VTDDLRIASVEVLILDSGVEYGTVMADGEVSGPRHTALVRVTTEDGFVGHADVDSNPWVVNAVVEAPVHIRGHSSGLAEAVVGQSARDPEALWARMYRHSWYLGRRGVALHAMSGVDIAVWDILGRAEGKPVCELLGEKRRDRIPAYASTLFRDTPDQMRRAAASYVERGFRAIKFGWASWGESVEHDRALLAAARDEVGPEIAIMVDGYIAGDLDDVVAHVRAIEDLEPTWVEEPLPADRPHDLAALGRATSVAIASGEQLGGEGEFAELLAEDGVAIVQPDVSRCGGFTAARQIARLAGERGARVVPHAWTSPLLTAASLHLDAWLADAAYIETNVSTAPVVSGLAEPPRLVDGCLEVPSGPGLGVDVDPAAIERFRM
jgi:L-rhamnonate dehydratase